MPLLAAIHNIMVSLSNTINHLPDDVYVLPSDMLSGETAGQHTRSIINFFMALDEGYEKGVVNYGVNKKGTTHETSRDAARRQIFLLTSRCSRPDKGLCIILHDGSSDGQPVYTNSSYFRELDCLYEQALLHTALIKIAVSELPSMECNSTKSNFTNKLSGSITNR